METVFFVAFFKFNKNGSGFGFERIRLQHIWKTEKEAREGLSFCDEAGWYEGALIEERAFGWHTHLHGKRIWLIQDVGGVMKEIPEPKVYNNIVDLIG